MKKTRLTADYYYNFTLLGLSSVAKEYKLAWSLNQALQINLVKQEDINIEFLNKNILVISNYLYQSENVVMRLLNNKSFDISDESLFLVPELRNFDFLIQVIDEADSFDTKEMVSRISALNVVSFVANIDTDKLKSKENLIFD